MIFIQARLNSTRCSSKVLFPIKGKLLVVGLYEQCSKVDRTVVLIPNDEKNLADILREYNVEFFMGHPTNVLGRYYKASQYYKPENIVRITADCPGISVDTLHYMLHRFKTEKLDFLSNVFAPRTFPDGEDVEIFSPKVMEMLHKYVFDDEHVTSYIYKNLEFFKEMGFKIDKHERAVDLSSLKTCIDTFDDYLNYTTKKVVNTWQN